MCHMKTFTLIVVECTNIHTFWIINLNKIMIYDNYELGNLTSSKELITSTVTTASKVFLPPVVNSEKVLFTC